MTNQTTEELMSAAGYGEVDGRFTRGGDVYEKTSGGWYVYTQAAGSSFGGAPWGESLPGGLIRLPYTTKPDAAAGLHPSTHPDSFIWVWPEDVIHQIFQYAPGHDEDGNALDNEWVKVDDGEGNVTFERA